MLLPGLAVVCCLLPWHADAKSKRKSPEERYRIDYVSKAAAIYTDAPDIAKCRAGRLSDSEKTALLATLNDFRRLAGLNPVTYDASYDDQEMQAALMMAANGRLDHNPPADWKCYSPDGVAGAGVSNLSGGVISPTLKYTSATDTIIGWIIDNHNIKGGIGHRKWLLNPYMTSVTYGSVSGWIGKDQLTNGAALRIFDGGPLFTFADDSNEPFATPRIIAYPYGDYPAKYYEDGAILSVALQINANNRFNGEVDYANTKVHLSEDGGEDLPVGDVSFDTSYFGLPMTLQFNPGALKKDVPYTVRLEGVLINGQPTDVSYAFRLVP